MLSVMPTETITEIEILSRMWFVVLMKNIVLPVGCMKSFKSFSHEQEM